EAENVGVGDGAATQAGAEDVANDAADAGAGPAVGFDGGGAVVRVDLDAGVEVVGEPHNTGVVGEDADAPVIRAEALAKLLRGGEDGLLKQVVVMAGLAIRVGEV